MFIESVELNNFRNYENLKIEFDPGTNLLWGMNAQGKTNILESLYLCGTTKSHRGSKDKDMVRLGQDEGHIRMMIMKNDNEIRIDMHLKKQRAKGIAINGQPIKRAADLFGLVSMVFFSPEDLNIIKNGPSERRKFMDMELCQLNKIYLSDLTKYNHILNQRNKLLKDIYFSPDLETTLEVWDEQLITYGKRIIRERKKFTEDLNLIIYDIHKNLTGKKEEIEILYEPDVTEESFADTLSNVREKDLKMKLTSHGPHRDDLCVKINQIDIRKYGSQGQQRTAALSLKLSEIYLVEKKIGDTPVLLLDDVLSELDSNRQHYLLQSIHDIQTLITCTGLDDFINSQFRINKIFRVTNGSVSNLEAMDENKGGNE